MAHVNAAQEGLIAPRRHLFRSSFHPVASAIRLDHSFIPVLHFPAPTQSTPSLLAPCLLPTGLHPLSRLSMRMHQLPALNGRHVAAISLSKSQLLRSGQVRKRGQKGVPGRAKKTPADPEHLTTTNSAPLTPTSMLMVLVEST